MPDPNLVEEETNEEVKYYNREEMLAQEGETPDGHLFGINEAIVAGLGADLPLFSARERNMAEAYKAKSLNSSKE